MTETNATRAVGSSAPACSLFLGDCLERMAEITDGSVDLTVTSPPYDNLRTYNGTMNDWTTEKWQAIIRELFRVTKQGGVVVWVVGDATINGSETGTSFRQALYAMECGFNLHDTMIYEKAGTGACGSNYAYWQSYEFMFVWSKGKPAVVNRIADKENVRSGTKRNRGRLAPDGSVKDTKRRVVQPVSVRTNIWRYPVGWANRDEKTGHPAVFPEALAREHILSWSNEGDTVLDPFLGSGTTGKMALLHGRNFIGIERDADYFRMASERISSANVAKAGLSFSFIQAKLFSNIEETKEHLADPDCCMCEGRGFYKVLCVGEYDEQEKTVQCACKRKQNLSRFDV